MASDLSRKRFEPQKDFSGVVMQQGRVQLDADWNEQVEIVDRRLRAETVDLLGRCAVPEETPDGFKISYAAGKLTIGRGRLYVDGLLAESRGKKPPSPREFDAVLAEERGTEPVPYEDQPYLPEATALPTTPGTYLVYLEAWQREVTHLEDPELVETAVGVDTTTRMQTAWQVKVHPEELGDVHCGSDIPKWIEKTRPSDGRVSTQGVDVPDTDNPCLIPPGGGYKGLENHLYRVEIHDGGLPGTGGTATFKWSRDNGIVAGAVTAIPALDTLVVDSVGRDGVLRFNDGDWVEVTDDFRELAGQPGEMRKIKKVHDATRTIELESNLPSGDFPTSGPDNLTDPERHTRIRRWDQKGEVKDTDGNSLIDLSTVNDQAIPVPAGGVTGTSVVLEKGVQVTFHTLDDEDYHVGDYWVVAARTVGASVTADESVEKLVKAPPRGIHRHYCRLALLHVGTTDADTWVTDCRPRTATCCTVTVSPGQDVQAAIDRVPAAGGRVCLLPGVHRLRRPLLIDGRLNLVLEGCGPGSKLVFDPPPGAPTASGVIFVAGGSRNVSIENLSVYSDKSKAIVVVDEDSAEVTVADTVLIQTRSDDCVVLGHCSDMKVEGSTLLGRVGVRQAGPDQLVELAAAIAELRPAPTADTGDDVTPAAVVEEAEEPTPQTLRRLFVENNHFLARRGAVVLEDALEGRIGDNLIHAANQELFETFMRPDPNAIELDPGALQDLKKGDFFAGLHELFSALAPPATEPDSEEIAALDSGLEACLLEDFVLCGNRIWAMIGGTCHYARSLRLAGNRIRATRAGIFFGYGFDISAQGSSIRIVGEVQEEEISNDPVKIILKARPGARHLIPGIGLGFIRGARISDNEIRAPEGMSMMRKGGSGCAEAYGASLVRLLRIGRLWRVVVALAWLLLQIIRLFWSKPWTEKTREELEDEMLAGLVTFLASAWVPSFLGKVVVAENRLETSRYGILFDQVVTLGGLRVRGNRVSGFARAGIRIHPRFSVGRPEVVGRWIRCLVKWLVDFLQEVHAALDRFLSAGGVAVPGDLKFDAATLAATLISGLLAFCARLCGHDETGDGGDGGEDGADTKPVEDLKDALGDLLDPARATWVDDLLNGAYRVEGNVLRGSGTGIWVGIDGTRVSGNRIALHSDNPVPYESIVLGGLLSVGGTSADGSGVSPPSVETTEELDVAQCLMDLDRDLLLLYCTALLFGEREVPSNLAQVVPAFEAYVPPDSPLAKSVAALTLAVNTGNTDLVKGAWLLLMVTIWLRLEGYGIVLVGGDMVCRDNQIDAKIACNFGEENWDEELSYPAVGGIWHFDNYGFVLEDLARLFVGGDINWRALLPSLLMAALAYQTLREKENDRALEISGNQIRNALAHGVRAVDARWLTEIDLRDNFVENAARIGIQFRGDGGTVKVQRNTVVRTWRVFGFGRGSGQPDFASLPGFARLIQVAAKLDQVYSDFDNNRVTFSNTTALVSYNHGTGWKLFGSQIPVTGVFLDVQGSAVYVDSFVAGVMGNHVITDASYALEVIASRGLATDNMANTGSQYSGLQQGPDVDNLLS